MAVANGWTRLLEFPILRCRRASLDSSCYVRSPDRTITMPEKHLLQTLDQLQDELSQMERVDDETRAALKNVTDAIEQRLSQTASSPERAESQDSLSGQLQDFMLGIEAEHPRLTRAVNQVAAALANLGI